MKDTGDIIIVRSCNFGKMLYFSFRKSSAEHILAAG